VTFLLVARHQKQRERKKHVTLSCVDSAGSSENHDSGEALTVTIASSIQRRYRYKKKAEKKKKRRINNNFFLSTATMDHGIREASVVVVVITSI
jgi:hypothetical protein